MIIFEKIIKLLDYQLENAPQLYGIFHIAFFVLMIGLAIYLCTFQRKADEKTYINILKATWITMIVFEVLKQVVFSFHYDIDTSEFSWGYQWYAFPYQFCSTPIYVLPFIIFIKNKKVKESCEAFLALYSFFAGLSVMVYPATVFTTTLIVNFQTMIHHGLQLAIGTYIIAYNINKIDNKYVLKAIVPYLILVAIALFLDELVHYVMPNELFNMFFISRHFDCSLPVLVNIQQKVPYLVFLLSYILGFTLTAYIINLLILLIKKTIKKTLVND